MSGASDTRLTAVSISDCVVAHAIMRHSTTTTVTWELTERSDGGTRLRLDHKGFSGLAGAVLAFMHGGGWKKMVRTRLLDRLRRTEAEGR